MTNEHPYGSITRVDAPTRDVSTWRPDLAEGYLAWQEQERQILRQHRRNVRLSALGLAVLTVLLAFEVRSVWQFGAWMPWATPRHIVHCGQTYRQEEGSDVESLQRLHVGQLRRVMSGPHFQGVYAPVPALGAFDACGPDLFLRSGSGYRDYTDGQYG
jgi:hypothetical protein